MTSAHRAARPHTRPAQRRYFRRVLLRWFAHHQRRFLWRQTSNPFHILIGEMFLQQTDAPKVALIYRGFVKAFPTARALAHGKKSEIGRFISQIGLNYRVERLRSAAHLIEDRFRGRVPADSRGLMVLPGVGPYIANAVLASAFGRRVAVLDTNVIRVLHRFFGLRSTRPRPRTDPGLWAAAQELLPRPPKMAKRWNYAMLDFAAIMCRHRNPRCVDCPCRRLCRFVATRRCRSERFQQTVRVEADLP